MNQTNFIRSTILECLRNNHDFNGIVSAEIDGFNFSAVDIALPDSDNRCQVYRIVIVKHI
ncbi:MAG: hypothetical protein FWE22_03345 [Firmicutes bacterium]|nr:hypothetical protein [Bacillota bacterium]